mmetsp:Transcript_17015/g.25807  ORF Transcript_17015/g.25807 Transcript_17015/m.25807 type:complete len:216 (-) Transcript_17015:693-1340(-)
MISCPHSAKTWTRKHPLHHHRKARGATVCISFVERDWAEVPVPMLVCTCAVPQLILIKAGKKHMDWIGGAAKTSCPIFKSTSAMPPAVNPSFIQLRANGTSKLQPIGTPSLKFFWTPVKRREVLSIRILTTGLVHKLDTELLIYHNTRADASRQPLPFWMPFWRLRILCAVLEPLCNACSLTKKGMLLSALSIEPQTLQELLYRRPISEVGAKSS